MTVQKPYILGAQHTSLKFSDTPKEQDHDLDVIFGGDAKKFPVKTGTEVGPGTRYRRALVEAAHDHGHKVHFARDNWIAVDREIIKPHSVIRGSVFVADNDETKGPGHDSVFATFHWEHADPSLGVFNWAVCHYPTKGRGKNDPNHDINQRYALYLHRWVKIAARGKDLAFISGDFNMNDMRSDWFFGLPMLSVADELKRWQNTGHGPIDGFASYDHDGRVKARSFKVSDDKDEFMFSDHFRCRATFEIGRLKTAA